MASKVRRKNYRIDVAKLERTKKILGTRTETETIHRALDLVANEAALARALKALIAPGPACRSQRRTVVRAGVRR